MKTIKQEQLELLQSFVKQQADEVPVTRKPLNAIVYTRVSTAMQEDNFSLKVQSDEIKKFAKKKGITLLKEFGGTAESAKSDVNRSEFDKMWKYAVANKKNISFILVYTIDRFSRTGTEAIALVKQMKSECDIDILAVTLPKDDTITGDFIYSIMLLVANMDNKMRAQRTVMGMRKRVEEGLWLGIPPRGYNAIGEARSRRTQLIINSEGKWLMKAFVWRDEGISEHDIRIRLKEKGVNISRSRLAEIFKNPFYAGFITSSLLPGEMIEGRHPPIVDIATFNRINAKRFKAGPYKKNTKYPLSSFVKLSGSRFSLAAYRRLKPSGKFYDYYKTNAIGVPFNISRKELEGSFADFIETFGIDQNLLSIDQLRDSLLTELQLFNKDLYDEENEIDQKLAKHAEQMFTLNERFYLGNGSMNQDAYDQLSKNLAEKQSVLTKRKEQLGKKLSNPEKFVDFALQLCGNLKEMWVSSDFSHKVMLQKLVFPNGVEFDPKIRQYRTQEVNSCISLIARISTDYSVEKKREDSSVDKLSRFVAPTGIEPVSKV